MSRSYVSVPVAVVLFFSLLVDSFAAGRNSLNVITRFPYQDTTRSISEAFPLVLSGTVLFVWADSTSIRCSKSTDEGLTWNVPGQVLTPIATVSMLTGIRTMTGRLIIAYVDNLSTRYTISDDNGSSWTSPVVLVGFPRNSLQLSQTSDEKLWLGSRSTIGVGVGGRYVTSTDNGATWGSSQILPNSPAKEDLCFVSGQGGALYCIYSTVGGLPNIQRITSTDGGATWSNAISIVAGSGGKRRPRIAAQSDGTLWLLYYTSDINYVKSTDAGTTWSSPASFTRYAGMDYMHNVSILNDKPIVTFASTRWQKVVETYSSSSKTQVWYGVIGETPDDNPPPIFLGGSSFHTYSNLENWITARVDDESGVSMVTATYSVNGVNSPPVLLFDDGMHFDGSPEDNTWGNGITPFPDGSMIECHFSVSDISGNTLNDVYGFGFVTDPPPSITHVTQGSSMQVVFNRNATFGKYVLPTEYPGFGLRYPVGSSIEHVFAGSLWVGGIVDTGGTGQRIKAVSTGFEGWAGPYYEFYPTSSPADSIWRVYGRNATKPAGWDQYWGSALPFRPAGDENFFNQYNDYTQPVAGHVPMKVKVIQSSYTWNDPLADGVQIVEFKIMNNSVRNIDSVYVAFYMEGDVGPITVPNYYFRNYSGYYNSLRTAYIHNPVDFGSTPLGLSILNTDRPMDSLRFAFQWYPGQQSPAPDLAKYNLMSSGVIMPDEYPALSDTRFLLSFGPFTIQPYTSPNPDTLRVAFALLSATDLTQLQVHAGRARDLYQLITSVKQVSPSVPGEFALEQNYPNPFNPSTKIKVQIAHQDFTTLEVFDMLGRRVATLINENMRPGIYELEFNGSGLSSGVYVYQLKSGNFVSSRKALLLK